MQRLVLFLVAALVLWAGLAAGRTAPTELRWYRGNTHTHTLWSDGDAAPEHAVDWYARNGYDFLVLSDHNILQQGERWFPVSEDGSRRLKPEELESLQARFPDEVRVRVTDDGREMRLVTLAELKSRFEEPGEFLLVPGEEVTAHWSGPERNYPVHVNALGIRDVIPPRGGDSVVELMNACVAAIQDHGAEHGVPVLAHLNHPNFGWGVSWEDLAQLRGDRFFEVYNGHRSVHNEGDGERPDTEAMWDLANRRRLLELDLPLLHGVATDDAHNYHGVKTSIPGRGWVVVRAEELSQRALIAALRAGEFYASSGVELTDVSRGPEAYEVRIAAEEGVEYTTRFHGVHGDGDPEVLHETRANPARYEYTGGELFVRATVVSSREHPRPYREGDRETAWTQPFAPRR